MNSTIDRVLGWIVKIAALIICAPVTALVAGQLFHDVPGVFRWVVQIAAVLLVEGVFLASWLQLENDRGAEAAYKVQRAGTAVGLYLGLWVLAWMHGEGLAGVVFRAALGAALFKSVWDSGVYGIIRGERRADKDISTTRAVRRQARRAARRVALRQIALDAERQIAALQVQHDAALAGVNLQGRRLLDGVKIDDRERRRELSERDAKLSVSDTFPMPIDQARARRDQARELSKGEAMRQIVSLLSDNPDVPKTDIADTVGRSRDTVYRYLSELQERGTIVQADTGSGYRVKTPNGHHHLTPAVSGNGHS